MGVNLPLYLSNILFSVVVDAVDAPLDDEELLWKYLGRVGECSDRCVGPPDRVKVFSDREKGFSDGVRGFSDALLTLSDGELTCSDRALGSVGHFLSHLGAQIRPIAKAKKTVFSRQQVGGFSQEARYDK